MKLRQEEGTGLPAYSPVALGTPWSLPQGQSAELADKPQESRSRCHSAPADLSPGTRPMTPIEQLRALTPDNPNRGLTAYVPDTVDDARALKARGHFDPHFIRRNCYNDGIWHNHEQSAAKDFVRQSTRDEMQARPIPDKDFYWDSTGTWSGDDALRKHADMARTRHMYPRQKIILGTGLPPVPSTSAKAENIGPAESCGACGHSPESTHNAHCYTCEKCGEAWYCSSFCRKTQSHCYPDEDEQDDEVVPATSEGVEGDISKTNSSNNSQEDDGIANYLKELGEMQKQGQDRASGVRGSHPENPSKESAESYADETVEKDGNSPIVTNTIAVPMVRNVRFEKGNHRTIEYQITSLKQGNPHWVDGFDAVLQAPAWLAAINIFWQYSEKNAFARKFLRYPEIHPEGLSRDPY